MLVAQQCCSADVRICMHSQVVRLLFDGADSAAQTDLGQVTIAASGAGLGVLWRTGAGEASGRCSSTCSGPLRFVARANTAGLGNELHHGPRVRTGEVGVLVESGNRWDGKGPELEHCPAWKLP